MQAPFLVQSGGYGQAGRGTARATSATGAALRSQQYGAAGAGTARPSAQAQRFAGASVIQGQQGVRPQQLTVSVFYEKQFLVYSGYLSTFSNMRVDYLVLSFC